MASYPPEITAKALDHLKTAFTDYSLAHGLAVRPSPDFAANPSNALSTVAPVSLYPSLFPRKCFEDARRVQEAYNNVYAAVAHDSEWLGKVIADLAAVDTFMKALFDVYLKAKEEGFAHDYCLGLFRSDYMLHRPTPDDEPCILQVEFNTISSSFGGLASRVSELHRFLVRSGAYPPTAQLSLESIPLNPAVTQLAAGLAKADVWYGPAESNREKAILFIVQPEERNAFDQRWLEYALLENHNIKTYHISLPDVPTRTRLESGSRRLIYTTPLAQEVEVSTVYFRAGYGPDDYPTQLEWDARLHLERSAAIKCPTIAMQLAGVKKVQQELTIPGALERFVARPEHLAVIRKTFTSIFPLDTSPEGLRARKLAFEEPEKYVLKPQREGGGNNVYREKIPGFLRNIGEDLWSGYILMELIQPPSVEGMIVRNGRIAKGGVIGELGVYGAIIFRQDTGEPVYNTEAGWLLRTKGVESEEGGVAAGFGCVDGICLID